MTPMTSINSPVPSPSQATGSRRTGLLVGGVAVFAVGMIAAAVLWFAAAQRNDDAIRGLARAPVGCDTTLNFAESGTYVIFVETTGSLDAIDGNCDETGAFVVEGSAPAVRVQLFAGDIDGEPLDLDRLTGVSYEGSGSAGDSIRSVEIVEPGTHVVRVQAPDAGVAIAIGRDPSDGVALLKNLAALSAIVGLIAGGVLLVLGSRRRDMTPAPEAVRWTSATSPPGAPTAPSMPGWQPAAGPPTTLRPPDQAPPPTQGWAAPTSAGGPPQPTWATPDVAVGNSPSPTSPSPTPWAWAPEQPERIPTDRPQPPAEIDDSAWAPPSD